MEKAQQQLILEAKEEQKLQKEQDADFIRKKELREQRRLKREERKRKQEEKDNILYDSD